jgi:hypothetical protein
VNPPNDIVTGERVKGVPAAAAPGAAGGHAP